MGGWIDRCFSILQFISSMCIEIFSMHARTHTHTHAYGYAYVHTHRYTWTSAYTYTYAFAYPHAYAYARRYTHAHYTFYAHTHTFCWYMRGKAQLESLPFMLGEGSLGVELPTIWRDGKA